MPKKILKSKPQVVPKASSKSKKITKTKAKAKKPAYAHIASHVLMVEPTQFFLNEETAKDNKFMERVKDSKSKSTQ
mgnify:CR=1 FL=1